MSTIEHGKSDIQQNLLMSGAKLRESIEACAYESLVHDYEQFESAYHRLEAGGIGALGDMFAELWERAQAAGRVAEEKGDEATGAYFIAKATTYKSLLDYIAGPGAG